MVTCQKIHHVECAQYLDKDNIKIFKPLIHITEYNYTNLQTLSTGGFGI